MELILMAMTGGTSGNGKSCGMITGGFCIPLASYPGRALEVVEAIGEDAVGEWLSDCDVPPPKAGGLWVLELEGINDDDEAPQSFSPVFLRWRQPTDKEVVVVLSRAKLRAAGRRDFNPPANDAEGRWAFIGARV
jgi:hypothetical protein